MRKLLLLMIALCLPATNIVAQKKDTVAYDLNLNEVEIVARRISHANEANAGAKVARIDLKCCKSIKRVHSPNC
ncbi:hypothetical protein [Bacteroides stercorirosoris]|uniref:hypothetical protein n=1 Tax=Bacteroides stercorirosoris TaxID=871324 RepID=UPI000A572713|nr:hypothetical protein [Bacteroides stercorirosoris]